MKTNDTSTQSPTWLSDLGDRLGEMISRNSIVLTGFLAAGILFTGYTLIETPGSWYVPIVALSVILVLFLTFVEARGFFKQVGAGIVTLLASAFSFLMGSIASTASSAALIWFAVYWILFFGGAALSYAIVRGRSRWGAIMLAEFVAFAAGYIGLFSSLSVYIAALCSGLTGLTAFVLSYYFSGKSRFSTKNMPVNVTTEEITENVLSAADASDWYARSSINSKTDEAHYLTWDDKAYLLVPISMEESFSIVGNRWSSGLGYMGRSINPWLVDMIYNKTPFWFSRGAPVMVVLLDLWNKNGTNPRVIAASIPDSRHRVPVGVIPAKSLLSDTGKSDGILEKIEDEFGKYTRELTEKQKNSLVSLVSKDDSSANYLSEAPSDESDEPEETDDTDVDAAKTAATD